MNALTTSTLLLLLTVQQAAAQSPSSIPVAQEPSPTPRAVCGTLGLDDSQLEFLTDRVAWREDEAEPLARLLYILPRIDQLQHELWARESVAVTDLEESPAELRLSPLVVTGYVSSLRIRHLSPELASRIGYGSYYELQVEGVTPARPLTLFSRHVPDAWLIDEGTAVRREPIRATALFLKLGSTTPAGATLCLATHRIHWHPHEPNPALLVTPSQAALGQLGFDVSRLSEVVQGQPLVQEDRDPFYDALTVAGRVPAATYSAVGVPLESVLPELILHPQQQAGRLVRWRGLARRAIRIRVPDADIQQRFGVREYFELEVFCTLDRPIALVDPRDGAELTYDSFPITVCTLQIPQGLERGDEIRQAVAIEGAFLKLRTYRSRFVEQANDGLDRTLPRRQLSPLLIGSRVSLEHVEITPALWPGWLLILLVIGGIAIAWGAGRWYARQDRPLQQWRRNRRADSALTWPPTPAAEAVEEGLRQLGEQDARGSSIPFGPPNLDK